MVESQRLIRVHAQFNLSEPNLIGFLYIHVKIYQPQVNYKVQNQQNKNIE